MLQAMNENEITRDENAIRFDVEFDTSNEKANINSIGARHNPYFIPLMLL